MATVSWWDEVKITETKEFSGEMTNVFDSFFNYLNQHNASEYLSHSGILLESEGVWGADHHGIWVGIDYDSYLGSNSPEEGYRIIAGTARNMGVDVEL